MKTTIDIILIVFAILMGVSFFFYIPRMLYWFEPLKKHKKYINESKSKIAIVIPAKNESKCIGRLLNSIASQTYDRDYFDVFVIVDNENDKTVEIAKTIIPNVNISIVKGQKCKGDALDGCIKEMLSSGYKCDYVSIIDADNILDKDYLKEVNNAIASNRDIIVSNRRNLNLEYNGKKGVNNWVSNCSGLTHTFQNELGNFFRSEHDMPLTFTGSGLSIRYSVFETLGGWPFKSLAEDAELSLFAETQGYTSYYADHATTYLEEGNSVAIDISRRVRWVSGFSVAQKKYLKAIKKRAHDGGKFNRKYADTLYSLIPLIGLIVTSFVSSFACLVTFIVSLIMGSAYFRALIWVVALLLILYVLMVIYTFIGLLSCKKYNKMTIWQKFIVLFANPIYCGLYVIVYFKAMVFKSKDVWVPTERIEF